MTPLVIAAGFGAGLLIAIATLLLEHSRIAFGSYALYGNGALIVPAILVPWALYWGWAWALVRGGRALELALFVVGLHFGFGMLAVIDLVVFPQRPGLGIADALRGLVLSGTIFVIPVSLVAALVYALFATGRVTLNALTLFVAAFVAALLAVFAGVGLGILTGITVDVARRDPTRRVPVGIALLVLLVVLANLPFVPALLG